MKNFSIRIILPQNLMWVMHHVVGGEGGIIEKFWFEIDGIYIYVWVWKNIKR